VVVLASPPGMKWSFVPKQSAKPKYVLCNGDESEPGTCKDRLIFEHDPHAVIEGVMIAALAVGSQTGYIYIRGEYRYLSIIMQKALADAYARGYLGKNIFGSGRDLDIYCTAGRSLRSRRRVRSDGVVEGKRGIRASVLPSRRSWACGVVLRSLIMPRPWPVCLTLFWWCRVVCESGHTEERRDTAVLHERQSRKARRVRIAHGLQPEEAYL